MEWQNEWINARMTKCINDRRITEWRNGIVNNGMNEFQSK